VRSCAIACYTSHAGACSQHRRRDCDAYVSGGGNGSIYIKFGNAASNTSDSGAASTTKLLAKRLALVTMSL
jgi:hypothetical protein